MVKRKRASDSENIEDKGEEICKNINEKIPAVTDIREPIGAAITRSKTALQLQQQAIVNGEINPDITDPANCQNQTKTSTDSELALSSNASTSKTVHSSSRQLKKSKRDPPVKSLSNQNTSKKGKIPDKNRTRRPWEVWSKEDIDTFFEGLCEFGKDFEKIQNFILQRRKKKGNQPNVAKNKDQVRHFYYRTFQKIAKHISLEDGVSKQAQELYMLINYSELRRKLGRGLHDKNEQRPNEFVQKLTDLVYDGVTTVKLKGRKIKVKTPLCRALKKLNNIEDPKFEESDKISKLPTEIKVKFCPKDMKTWCRIQGQSMNPRVKLNIGLQRRFSDIISFLEKRWKPHRLKMRDNLLNNVTASCLQQLELRSNDSDSLPVLKVSPRSSILNHENLVSITTLDNSSSIQNLTLRNFIGSPESSKSKKINKNIEIKDKNSSQQSSSISTNIPVSSDNVLRTEDTAIVADSTNSKTTSSTHNNVNIQDHSKENVNNVNNDNVNNQSGQPNNTPLNAESKTPSDNDQNVINELDGNVMKAGFTAESAASLTIGQLYLMMNRPDCIVLDYEWIDSVAEDTETNVKQPTDVLKDLIRVASVSLTTLSKLKQDAVSTGNISACCCGHLCSAAGSSSAKQSHKNTSSSKNNVTTRGNTPNRNNNGTAKTNCGSLKSSTGDISEGSHEASHQNEQGAHVSSDLFVKPTHVAPRSSQNIIRANVREQIEKFGLSGSLRRIVCRPRPMRKPMISQRTLFPKTNPSSPVVTVQLIPPTQLSSQMANVNPADVQKVLSAAPSTAKQVRIIPAGGRIVDLTSLPVKVVSSVSQTPTSVTQMTVQPHSTLSDRSGETGGGVVMSNSSHHVINSGDILSSITASIMVDSSRKQYKDDPVIGEAQIVRITESGIMKTASILTDSSPPRLSIPEHNSNDPSSSLPSSISALLDTTANKSLQEDVCENGKSIVVTSANSNLNDQSSSPTHAIIRASSPVLSSNWLDGENSEYSLSTFLGGLDSPLKSLISVSNSASAMSDGSSLDGISRLSNDVDTQLQCLMNENSIDYVAKFADLAAHIASSDTNRK